MNVTENFVIKFYHSIGITEPYQLSIDVISKKLRISIVYWNYTSEINKRKGKYRMFLNKNLSKCGQWVDFGHELGHYFHDEEHQSCLPQQYIDYQEFKANYFSYHFCVPTFMLQNLRGVTVYDVMHLFNVEFDFAYRRLEMYKHKVITGGFRKWRRNDDHEDMQDLEVMANGN